MAIFNILSGGYYKKLGNTVGQRYRNQRVVHSYVVPKNPRTDPQQTNRVDFADCTGATQLSMQLNGNSLLWNDIGNTIFNKRMSLSRQLADAGGAFYSYVPVIPYGTNAAYSFEPSPSLANATLTWKCLTTDDISGRQMAVALRLKNENTDKLVNYVTRPTITGSSGNWQIEIVLPSQLVINPSSWQIGISCDDEKEPKPPIYLAPMDISALREHVTTTLSNPVVNWVESTGEYQCTVTTTPALRPNTTVLTNVTLTGVLQGVKTQQSAVLQRITSDGKLYFTFAPTKDALNQRILFPSGSTIAIGAFSATHTQYIYDIQSFTGTFSSTLERQNYNLKTVTAVKGTDGKYTIDSGITGVASAGGGINFNAKSMTTALVQSTVAINCSQPKIETSLKFITPNAPATVYWKEAQTATPTAVPFFVKNGVTYNLLSTLTVNLAKGETTFTLTTPTATITFAPASAQMKINLNYSTELPVSIAPAFSGSTYGVLQAEWRTDTYTVTAARAGSSTTAQKQSLAYTITLQKDTLNQCVRFPTGGTVNAAATSTAISGYTFSIAGFSADATESSIATQTYIYTPQKTENNSYITWIFKYPTQATNIEKLNLHIFAIEYSEEEMPIAGDYKLTLDQISDTQYNYEKEILYSTAILGKNNKAYIENFHKGTFRANGIEYVMCDIGYIYTDGAGFAKISDKTIYGKTEINNNDLETKIIIEREMDSISFSDFACQLKETTAIDIINGNYEAKTIEIGTDYQSIETQITDNSTLVLKFKNITNEIKTFGQSGLSIAADNIALTFTTKWNNDDGEEMVNQTLTYNALYEYVPEE